MARTKTKKQSKASPARASPRKSVAEYVEEITVPDLPPLKQQPPSSPPFADVQREVPDFSSDDSEDEEEAMAVLGEPEVIPEYEMGGNRTLDTFAFTMSARSSPLPKSMRGILDHDHRHGHRKAGESFADNAGWLLVLFAGALAFVFASNYLGWDLGQGLDATGDPIVTLECGCWWQTALVYIACVFLLPPLNRKLVAYLSGSSSSGGEGDQGEADGEEEGEEGEEDGYASDDSETIAQFLAELDAEEGDDDGYWAAKIKNSRYASWLLLLLEAWNFLLCAAHAAAFVGIAAESVLLLRTKHESASALLCDTVHTWQGGVWFWTRVFAALKWLELFNTLFLVARQKPISHEHWTFSLVRFVFVWVGCAYHFNGTLVYALASSLSQSVAYFFLFRKTARAHPHFARVALQWHTAGMLVTVAVVWIFVATLPCSNPGISADVPVLPHILPAYLTTLVFLPFAAIHMDAFRDDEEETAHDKQD